MMADKDVLGDQPIEEQFRGVMNAVARSLDGIFNGAARGKNRKVGFVLLLFPFSAQSGRCNYISNGADRKDVVRLMREQIEKFERDIPDG